MGDGGGFVTWSEEVIVIAYDATGFNFYCPDCEKYVSQTAHRCPQDLGAVTSSYAGHLSAVDAAAMMNKVLVQPLTTKTDVELKREQSRRDLKEKRRELRHNKVMKR